MITLLSTLLLSSMAFSFENPKSFCTKEQISKLIEYAGSNPYDQDTDYLWKLPRLLNSCGNEAERKMGKFTPDGYEIKPFYKEGTLQSFKTKFLGVWEKEYQSLDYFYGVYLDNKLVTKLECRVLVNSKCGRVNNYCGPANPPIRKVTGHSGNFNQFSEFTCCIPSKSNGGKIPTACEKGHEEDSKAAPSPTESGSEVDTAPSDAK